MFLFACNLALAEDIPPPNPAAVAFFESKIRPILVDSCLECHGSDKTKGSLRLDSLSEMVKGGESGPALVPGKPDKSLIISAVTYDALEMPPTGKLPDDKISLLKQWIAMGAPWPNDRPTRAAASVSSAITAEDRSFWSFQPPKRARAVVPDRAAESAIGAFIVARLADSGLTPHPLADRRVQLRRLTFDLVGLPPTYEEVEEFIADDRPDAWARRVDQLLSSPRFGERWGRHWLDVVRYAQSNGYERDAEKPFAWRYRDYVIDSLNANKPYDQFVREQIAGDELDQVTDESIVATGFARLGVWDDEPDDKANAEFESLDDIVATTGQAFLGLTVGCARCHDHKFDPIRQTDYYSLVAFFRNVKPYEIYDAKKENQGMLARLSDGQWALAMREHDAAPPTTHVLIRGDAHSPGSPVDPRFIEVLSASEEVANPKLSATEPSHRRGALAQWLITSDHPLTARVIVNRLWHHHFGRGIVSTPSDFGKTGSAPSHPELLDWLALELVESGWDLKHMHRLMLQTDAYRRDARHDAQSATLDPDNTLLWRGALRRLEAEIMRDAVLLASGELNLSMGGGGVYPTLPPEVLSTQSRPGDGWTPSTPAEQARRSIYIFIKRTLKPPLLETFDFANTDQSVAARATTTIAPQALIWLNSPFMNDQASLLAKRIDKEVGGAVDQKVDRLFEIALQRRPTPAERSACLGLMGNPEATADGGATLTPLCRVILNTNEFVYVE